VTSALILVRTAQMVTAHAFYHQSNLFTFGMQLQWTTAGAIATVASAEEFMPSLLCVMRKLC
jgi:hypothetical protein